MKLMATFKTTLKTTLASLLTAALVIGASSPVWFPVELHALGFDYNQPTTEVKVFTDSCQTTPRSCQCRNYRTQTCRTGTSDCTFSAEFYGDPWPGHCYKTPIKVGYEWSFLLRLCIKVVGSFCGGHWECDCNSGI